MLCMCGQTTNSISLPYLCGWARHEATGRSLREVRGSRIITSYQTDHDRYCWRCRDHWRSQGADTIPQHSGLGRHDRQANPPRPCPADQYGVPRQQFPHQQSSSGSMNPLPPPARRQPVNPFGTREEWESDQYQSPIAGMLNRAWDRYRDAEASRRRAEVAAQDLLHIRAPTPPVIMPQRSSQRPPISLPDQFRRANPFNPLPHGHDAFPEAAEMSWITAETRAMSLDDEDVVNPIDVQESRPPALPSEAMITNIACRICDEQRTDTLVLPCYHLSICRWCAQIMRDRSRQEMRALHDQIPGQGWRCPLCRKAVIETRRVYIP